MPYSKCPIYGSVSHLNVADPAIWYRERYQTFLSVPWFAAFVTSALVTSDYADLRRFGGRGLASRSGLHLPQGTLANSSPCLRENPESWRTGGSTRGPEIVRTYFSSSLGFWRSNLVDGLTFENFTTKLGA